MNPYDHSLSSVKQHGGRVEDYLDVHTFLDSSKEIVCNPLHRIFFHNSFFIYHVLERIWFTNSCPMTKDGKFPYIINSDGKHVPIRLLGETHIYEDFAKKFIPSAQDWISNLVFRPWMNNGRGDAPGSSLTKSPEPFELYPYSSFPKEEAPIKKKPSRSKLSNNIID